MYTTATVTRARPRFGRFQPVKFYPGRADLRGYVEESALGFDWAGLLTNAAQAAVSISSARNKAKTDVAMAQARARIEEATAKAVALQSQAAVAAFPPSPYPPGAVVQSGFVPRSTAEPLPSWVLPAGIAAAAGVVGLLLLRR